MGDQTTIKIMFIVSQKGDMFLILRTVSLIWFFYRFSLVPNIRKANSEIKNYRQNHVKFNVHRTKMELQHYSQKRPNPAYFSIWLVALCLVCIAEDVLGRLFTVITISPLQSYPKYLKTIR